MSVTDARTRQSEASGFGRTGTEIPIQDPRLEELQPIAREAGNDPEPVITGSDVFGWLAHDPLLVESIRRVLDSLERDGMRETVHAYVNADPRSTQA